MKNTNENAPSPARNSASKNEPQTGLTNQPTNSTANRFTMDNSTQQNEKTQGEVTPLAQAKIYQRRGWQPLPIPHGSKNPNLKEWQRFKTTEADLPKYFNGAALNIGVLLGGGLTDIDLDSSEAVKIADYFLPETKSEFGRNGKPRSHRLYNCINGKFEKFNNPFFVSSKDENERKNACIVEFRTGDGLQTVFPCSTHTSGEIVEWHKDGEPLPIDAQTLRRAVACVASACLIATVWRSGMRQDLALAVSGALLRNGFDISESKNFIRAVCVAANDEETADRLKAVDATAQKLKRGENVFGFPKLAELTDKKLVEAVCKWLGIERRQQTNNQADAQPEFTDEPKQQNEKNPLRRLKTVRMSDVVAEKVEWLWNPFIPLGTLTLIDGEEGIGKSLIALQGLGCAVANGKKIDTTSGVLSFIETEASNVLLMSAEESLPFVVKARLQAVNAPCERFIAIDEPFTLDSDGITRLSMEIAEYEPKLVIIDPLFSYTGKVRLNDDNEIRSITDPLTKLAEKYECAIVGIRHINKSKGFGDARNAGLNGVGWRAAARSALLVGIDKETGKTAIVQTKSNLSEVSKKSFGYKIESTQITIESGEIISAPKLFWTGESDLTAETMLSAMRSETTEEKSEKHDAISFLRDALKSGEKTSVAVFSDAKKNGISERTLKRAKADLGIKSVKRGGTFGGEQGWFWFLPDAEECQENAEECQRNKVGTLPSKRVYNYNNNNNLAEECHLAPFSQKDPQKPTEECQVAPFSQTIENATTYADNPTEGCQASISGTLQQEKYPCLHCGADISLTAETCPECSGAQIPTF
jgi:RecA-family ATPase